uniref:DUF3668 domain-containing protein n=1 Tax=Anopheles farauti TaxID=69004 RepID=A0A182QIT6_9DIPT
MQRTETPNVLGDQQEVIIYLKIFAGVHFNQDKQGHKIGLVASLNQQQLNAVSRRPVTPGSGSAVFDSRFVWTCHRLSLKDMKTKNVPIKLDCCEIQPAGGRSHIGSVVIQLRSIPVVSLARTKFIKPRWYRLIGVESKRWRQTRPELQILAMVTSTDYLNQGSDRENSSPMPELSVDEYENRNAQCTTIYTEPKANQLPSNVKLVPGRGLLQIGTDESDVDLFLFEIILKCGQHLDQLQPGADTFRLRYELYGEKYFSLAERKAPGSAVFLVKEKISIHLRSSLKSLDDYFTNCFTIALEVLPNDDDAMAHSIGSAMINFHEFVNVTDLEEFKEKYAAKNNTLETVRSIAIHDASAAEQQRHTRDKVDKVEEQTIVPLLVALQHPKADTPFTRANLELLPDVAVHADRIEFGDLTMELLFSSLPDRVVETIGAEPSKLTLNGPHGSYALARLDNESLLVGTRENQPSGVVVMVNETGENVAIASISCTLTEVGLNYNSQLLGTKDHSCYCQMRPAPASAFNETIVYQLVEEQKTWMREQREQFIAQLKEKEHSHLQTLAQNWKQRHAEAEKRLAERLAHADALTVSLEEAQRKLVTQPPHETERIKQLEKQFHSQLVDIRAKAVRLSRDAEAQIETTRRQCHELQQQLAELATDQKHLLDTNRKLRLKLDEEGTERTQQVTELKQQLEDATNSKLYYKEEWAKQMRKVHQLEKELSLARTPYFQPPTIGRKSSRKKDSGDGSGGSQVSVVHSQGGISRQGGGGDCCKTYDCQNRPNCYD